MRSLLVNIFMLLLILTSVDSFAQRAYVLEGATIIDGAQDVPLEDRVIVVNGDKITGIGKSWEVIIPPNAKRINLKGKYVIPGLVDGHVHYETPRDLIQMLAWGITSVNCMFESTTQALEMERMTAKDTARSPQIYPMAPVFSAKGGWWDEGFPADSAINRFPGTTEEAREQVRKVKSTGIRRIKLMYDEMRWCRDSLPPLKRMDPEIMRAIIDEANKQKLFTGIHAPVISDAREILDAGGMSFVHGVVDDYLDPAFIEDLQRKNVYYVPTFSLYEFLADVEGFMNNALADKRFRSALPADVLKRYSSKEYYQRYRQRYPNTDFVKSRLPVLRGNISGLVNNYAPLVMGTDMWALPGISAHLELEYMVKAGMTPFQAIIYATTFGSQYLGAAAKIGTVEAGKQADMLVLDANPLTDIRNTRSIHMVIKRGKMFNPKQLIKESKQ